MSKKKICSEPVINKKYRKAEKKNQHKRKLPMYFTQAILLTDNAFLSLLLLYSIYLLLQKLPILTGL